MSVPEASSYIELRNILKRVRPGRGKKTVRVRCTHTAKNSEINSTWLAGLQQDTGRKIRISARQGDEITFEVESP